MDSETAERFRTLEQKVDGMEGRVRARVDAVAHGLDLALQAASSGIIAAIHERVDLRFAETMRAFQAVTDERQKVAELEARVAKLEALLAAGGRQ